MIAGFKQLSWGYRLALLAIAILFIFPRVHNAKIYNPWWGDDGGAHVAYIDIVKEEGRLPTMDETYLAWHEPGYYKVIAVWASFGEAIGLGSLRWIVYSQIAIMAGILFLVWKIAMQVTKSKAVALLTMFTLTVLFQSVKLSALISNEPLTQLWILVLISLFFHWKLHTAPTPKRMALWAGILGVGLWIKLTVVLPLFGALLFYFITLAVDLYKKKKPSKQTIGSILIMICVPVLIYSPWLVHKQNVYGSGMSTNIYELENKKPFFNKEGFTIMRTLNTSIFQQPYWETKPYSFVTILFADIFIDYYNLFNNIDELNALPEEQKIVTGNNRVVTASMVEQAIKSLRMGVALSIIWMIGSIGMLIRAGKQKIMEKKELMIWIMILGGMGALVHNVMTLPYIARGVLKIHFVYFILPLIMIMSYHWMYNKLGHKNFLWLYVPVCAYACMSTVFI